MKAWQLVHTHGRRLIGRTVVDEAGDQMVIEHVNLAHVASIAFGARPTGWVAMTDWPVDKFLYAWEEVTLVEIYPPHFLDRLAQIRWARRQK